MNAPAEPRANGAQDTPPSSPAVLAAVGRLWRGNHAWFLIAAALLLFCTNTLFNVPLWIMAAIGIGRIAVSPRRVVHDSSMALLGVLFLCIWVPQLLALPDAVNLARALEIVLPYIHFYFAGVFMVQALRDPACYRRTLWAVFAIMTFWCADALLQFLAGKDLFGYPYRPGQLNGVFHPKLRLGHLLAVLAPIYLHAIHRVSRGSAWPWLLGALMIGVILLSGKRAAWVMAAVSCGGFALYFHLSQRAISWRRAALGAALGVLAIALVLAFNPPLEKRANVTLGLFSGELEQTDRAMAHRLPIWRTAWTMIRQNWINGVGPRGFRFAFRDYAETDNFYLQHGRAGQTHPHQMLLEVAAETGMIGVLGLALFWAALIRIAWRAIRDRPSCAPWFIAAGAAWLPLNAHLAFYGSYWSSIAWWILPAALGISGLAADEQSPDH